MNTAQIKEIIRRDLPIIMREDMEIQSFILHIARTHFADKRETESRFDRILDELRRDREEQGRKWDEQKIETQRYREEQNRKWEEQNKKWEENQQDIRKLFDKYDTGIGALGSRWGLHAEEAFRNGLKGILEDSFGVEVLNVTEFDDAGEVFGSPDQVELDIIIRNGVLILCEIKSSMSRGDVYIFNRKISFYEKRHNRKSDRKIIISPMVDKYGRRVAEKLNIEVYSCCGEVGI
ncbi:MAG: hypothetical protein BWK80_54970 [Desulfobacteraceae bacterium IS3]|nr:MAG: hypothetical protein BWK80_54970 [Desulfobacteraceae bacterium IS3]